MFQYMHDMGESDKVKLDYFANKEYISNSMLGWLKKSPAYFQACINGNYEQKESLSLERGSLLHLYVLEPHKFIVEDIEPISGLMGSYIKHRASGQDHSSSYTLSGFKIMESKVCENFEKPENQAYYRFLKEANGKIAINKQDKYIIDRCYQSVYNNSVANKLLFGEDPDVEIFNEYEIYIDDFIEPGFKAKAKLDRLIINRKENYAIIVDLKTTAKSVYGDLIRLFTSGYPEMDYYATGFMKSYITYTYYRQQAYYAEMVKKHFGVGKVESFIIPVETSGMFECAVYKQSDIFHSIGLHEIQRLVHSYIKHCETGDWLTPLGWDEKGYKMI